MISLNRIRFVRVHYPEQIENRGYKESGNYLTLTRTTADPESEIESPLTLRYL
jgi:hypothetical protein